jgi:hypothetical protein
MALTRRQVLLAGGGLAATLGVGSKAGAEFSSRDERKGPRTIYRLSSRGRRASKGVKAHNANMRFKTQRAADLGRAHACDTSRIVPLTVSHEVFKRLFPNGEKVADLRWVYCREQSPLFTDGFESGGTWAWSE